MTKRRPVDDYAVQEVTRGLAVTECPGSAERIRYRCFLALQEGNVLRGGPGAPSSHAARADRFEERGGIAWQFCARNDEVSAGTSAAGRRRNASGRPA